MLSEIGYARMMILKSYPSLRYKTHIEQFISEMRRVGA